MLQRLFSFFVLCASLAAPALLSSAVRTIDEKAVKSAPITLAAADAQEVGSAAMEVERLAAEWQTIAAQNSEAEVDATKALELLGRQSRAWARLRVAQTKLEGIRSKHRAAYKCDQCDYSPDLKSLVPKSKPVQ